MSNATGAFGLRPVRHLNGSPYNGGTQKCYISASYAVALFVGDPVLFSPTLAEKDTTARYPTINKAANGIVRGVIVSFDPLPAALDKVYNPASTERYANVCMDPYVIYQVRDDGAGTPSKVYPGQNAEMTHGAGSTTTGLSGSILDTSTPTTTVTFPLHIVGLAEQEDNELGDYAVWEVLLNTCELAAGRFLGITAA